MKTFYAEKIGNQIKQYLDDGRSASSHELSMGRYKCAMLVEHEIEVMKELMGVINSHGPRIDELLKAAEIEYNP